MERRLIRVSNLIGAIGSKLWWLTPFERVHGGKSQKTKPEPSQKPASIGQPGLYHFEQFCKVAGKSTKSADFFFVLNPVLIDDLVDTAVKALKLVAPQNGAPSYLEKQKDRSDGASPSFDDMNAHQHEFVRVHEAFKVVVNDLGKTDKHSEVTTSITECILPKLIELRESTRRFVASSEGLSFRELGEKLPPPPKQYSFIMVGRKGLMGGGDAFVVSDLKKGRKPKTES
jgi:hypothetical protein